jgi:hypothetical protein
MWPRLNGWPYYFRSDYSIQAFGGRTPQTPERISFSVGCLHAAEARICNNLRVTSLAGVPLLICSLYSTDGRMIDEFALFQLLFSSQEIGVRR